MNRLGETPVGTEVVDRSVDGPTGSKDLQLVDQKRVVNGVRVVEVAGDLLFWRQCPGVAIVRVQWDHGDRFPECSAQSVCERGLTSARGTGDADEVRIGRRHQTIKSSRRHWAQYRIRLSWPNMSRHRPSDAPP